MSALLAAPVGWLVIAYLGSLLVLFVAAFWRLDPFTAEVIRDYSFSNFQTLWDSPVYRDIALRTIAIAAAVTLIDAVSRSRSRSTWRRSRRRARGACSSWRS